MTTCDAPQIKINGEDVIVCTKIAIDDEEGSSFLATLEKYKRKFHNEIENGDSFKNNPFQFFMLNPKNPFFAVTYSKIQGICLPNSKRSIGKKTLRTNTFKFLKISYPEVSRDYTDLFFRNFCIKKLINLNQKEKDRIMRDKKSGLVIPVFSFPFVFYDLYESKKEFFESMESISDFYKKSLKTEEGFMPFDLLKNEYAQFSCNLERVEIVHNYILIFSEKIKKSKFAKGFAYLVHKAIDQLSDEE